jgi:hypothetical protein
VQALVPSFLRVGLAQRCFSSKKDKILPKMGRNYMLAA